MSGEERFHWLRNAEFIESDGTDNWRVTKQGEWALMTLAEAWLTNERRQEAACGPFTIRRAYSVPSDEEAMT